MNESNCHERAKLNLPETDQFIRESAISLSRREFLRSAAFLGTILNSRYMSSVTILSAPSLLLINPASVEQHSLREGVTGYTIRRMDEAFEIQFAHMNPSLAGILRIYPDHRGSAVLLELVRSSVNLVISFNLYTTSPYFVIQRETDQQARFNLSEERWQGVRSKDHEMLIENATDVRIAMAIYADFEAATVEQIKSQQQRTTSGRHLPRIIALNCPCSNDYTVRGEGGGAARSLACQNAINDANTKCTNQWCWGCCGWIGQPDICDCACAIGDYLCWCGKTGKYCYAQCSS